MAATAVEATPITTAFEDISLDDISSRHRKERKELQAKIQELKKNAPKKKRKEVLEEIARMESTLEQRQAKELSDVNNVHMQEATSVPVEPKLLTDVITKPTGNRNDASEIVAAAGAQHEQQQQRVSKAQKRRDKKLREAKHREAEILACQEDSKTAPNAIETRAIISILKERQLMMHQIQSDGDCLYNAIRHQLQQSGMGIHLSVAQLREETANYIMANKSTLICYMTNPNTGDLLSDDEFSNYCDSVRNTSAWGGQIELKALSSILKVPIEVLQATGTPTVQGADEFAGPNLIITYHRHMYSLGEHYNSTKTLENEVFDSDA